MSKTKQEQIKKGILQVMACRGEVKGHVYVREMAEPEIEKKNCQVESIHFIPDYIISTELCDVYPDEPETVFVPYFHRLSSLTKEITVDEYNDGKVFIPIDHMCSSKREHDEYKVTVPKGVFSSHKLKAWQIDQLHAWGFFTGPQQLFESGDLIDKLNLKK